MDSKLSISVSCAHLILQMTSCTHYMPLIQNTFGEKKHKKKQILKHVLSYAFSTK